jgi:hypothetical protein
VDRREGAADAERGSGRVATDGLMRAGDVEIERAPDRFGEGCEPVESLGQRRTIHREYSIASRR